jgi:hypothetical protein
MAKYLLSQSNVYKKLKIRECTEEFRVLLHKLKYVYYTGCFIMYSGITKIYYRKTVGHVFTKPVQILEGNT